MQAVNTYEWWNSMQKTKKNIFKRNVKTKEAESFMMISALN